MCLFGTILELFQIGTIMKLGEVLMPNFKNIRLDFKKTQQEIADFLGITRPTYSRYENGEREPDYETLKKIADYFDVTTDYLLGRTEQKEKDSSSEEDERSKILSLVGNDPRKIQLMELVLSLDEHNLNRFEKLLDAAELLPRE